MLYPNLKFKSPSKRPFFYTNFVQTVDGKVSVKEKGYWPIGSKKDYQTLVELRSYADCLIHGGELAREFGEVTLKSINKTSFKKMRKGIGKDPSLPYYVITHHPRTLSHLENTTIFSGTIPNLVKELKNRGYKHVLVEGGPTLLGSFVKLGLIDEVFLTISPKIYGSKPNSTKTLIEGVLLPQNKFKLSLISYKEVKDELFLRYRLKP